MAPHAGCGGWAWCIGAAGWLYRAGLESILGFQQQDDHLMLEPCIPKPWPHFKIAVENPDAVSQGVVSTVLDGAEISGQRIPLCDYGVTHRVCVTLGSVDNYLNAATEIR